MNTVEFLPPTQTPDINILEQTTQAVHEGYDDQEIDLLFRFLRNRGQAFCEADFSDLLDGKSPAEKHAAFTEFVGRLVTDPVYGEYFSWDADGTGTPLFTLEEKHEPAMAPQEWPQDDTDHVTNEYEWDAINRRLQAIADEELEELDELIQEGDRLFGAVADAVRAKVLTPASHPAPAKTSGAAPKRKHSPVQAYNRSSDAPDERLDDKGGRPYDWREDALCAETDPEAFFPERGGSTREAKGICAACGVRSECLEYALTVQERFGVWGGLSERERRRVIRARGITLAADWEEEFSNSDGPDLAASA